MPDLERNEMAFEVQVGAECRPSKINCVKSRHEHIVCGKVPEKQFEAKTTETRRGLLNKDDGMDPLKRLLFKFTSCNAELLTNASSGIDPENKLLEISMASSKEEELVEDKPVSRLL
jgi:hypothetical protein